MKLGWFRILSTAALVCGCALAALAQMAAAQGTGKAGDGVHYLRDMVVEKGETLHTLVCMFCSVIVRGEVKGDVVTVWGSIEIEGKLEGDAVAAGGKIVLRGEGAAEGDLVAVGGRVERKGTGVIEADISEVPFIYLPGQRNVVVPGTLIFMGANLLFSMSYLVAGRERVETLAETLRRRTVIVFIVGALGMTPLVWAFVWASDSGKYEDEAMLAVWLVMLLLVLPGCAGASLAVGRRLRRDTGIAAGIFLGALVLTMLALLPLAGLLAYAIVWVFALGATFVGRFGFAPPKTAPALSVSGH